MKEREKKNQMLEVLGDEICFTSVNFLDAKLLKD